MAEMLARILTLVLGIIVSITVQALENDAEQLATLDADEIEIDFKTGIRTYKGNVVFRQGSIEMTCNQLTTHFDDDGELEDAVCEGSPGTFRQRPEGQEHDVIGKALEITFDQANQLVTMKSGAEIAQENSSMSGSTITYDLEAEKATVKSGSLQDAVETEEVDSTGAAEAPMRTRLVIQPRQPED